MNDVPPLNIWINRMTKKSRGGAKLLELYIEIFYSCNKFLEYHFTIRCKHDIQNCILLINEKGIGWFIFLIQSVDMPLLRCYCEKSVFARIMHSLFISSVLMFYDHIIKSCTDLQNSVGNCYQVRRESSAKT